MFRLSKVLPVVLILACTFSAAHAADYEADIIVYGGTSAAVIAAVQAEQMGKSVIIVSPDTHLGGLSSGGLGWTDTGNKAVIGGLARDFYHRIWLHYYGEDSNPEQSWKLQPQDQYSGRGQGTPAVDGTQRTMWIFEPHVAEAVFDSYIAEHNIELYKDQWLDRSPEGVTKKEARITSFRTLGGDTFAGKVFIDATYEGDLLAAAGVDFHVGREGKEVYGEEWNGVQTGILHHQHHFDTIPEKKRIDPYLIPGDPSSGVLPRISTDPPGEKYEGDSRVQAYCFRMCMTNHETNRIPFPKPDNYDPSEYELLGRILDAGWKDVFRKFDPVPNFKTDTNNHGPFSSDNIGRNYAYPEASYEERETIIQEHRDYQMGYLYYLANDPRVPAEIREKMSTWGLPKDEFTDNGHWPHQLYIREARRMVGAYVMTEHELIKTRPTPRSIGMGSYTMDSHNVQRYITPEGYVQNEGDIGVKLKAPYDIAYDALIPKKEQCENLLVPVCVSSSHIAFGSIRMEPVFMILGQSAATAASHAIDSDSAVQDVDYPALRAQLITDGQIIEHETEASGSGIDSKKLPGITLDDSDAEFTGNWKESNSTGSYLGHHYCHDNDARDGTAAAKFTTPIKPGDYDVRIAYSHNPNRATNVPISILHADGEETLSINQRTPPTIDDLFLSLGTYRFDDSATITLSNTDTDGYVIADGVQLVLQQAP